MGLVQKFFSAILPASTLAKWEAESRKWMCKCNECGAEKSIWEMGGIRYSATGSKTTYVRCDTCERHRMHTVYYSAQ